METAKFAYQADTESLWKAVAIWDYRVLEMGLRKQILVELIQRLVAEKQYKRLI